MKNKSKIMKVLTVKQPWAYLLCAGIKDIENRTWKLPESRKSKYKRSELIDAILDLRRDDGEDNKEGKESTEKITINDLPF